MVRDSYQMRRRQPIFLPTFVQIIVAKIWVLKGRRLSVMTPRQHSSWKAFKNTSLHKEKVGIL